MSRLIGDCELVMACPKDARETALALLGARAIDSTVCPSEVAKALAAASGMGRGDWRAAMPVVHDAIDRLVAEGTVRLSWKGQWLATRSGPYRIGRGSPD